jgi:hypothetical protein
MLYGKCQDCGHSSIQHFSHFNKHVLNPIQRAGYQGDGRRAMMKLKNEVLDKSLIRRTKQSRAEDMNLPSRHVNIRTIRLHPVEEDFYNALYTQNRSSFDDYVTEGTLLNNYAHIFDLLTKMRQAVDHPYLIVYSKKNTRQACARNAPALLIVISATSRPQTAWLVLAVVQHFAGIAYSIICLQLSKMYNLVALTVALAAVHLLRLI